MEFQPSFEHVALVQHVSRLEPPRILDVLDHETTTSISLWTS